MKNKISLQIPSIIENIRVVESFIDNAKEEFHINDDIYGNIMIAVTESVNNAIQHGNQSDKDKNVHLTLDINDHDVCFTVKDEGDGFDPKNIADPLAPENIEDMGGRGIFLIKQLADEVSFSDKGEAIKMVFYMNQ